jgi:FkbM family methyltransferase
MPHRMLTGIVHAAERVVGRPRLAKTARLLTNEVRLDAHNDIGSNGEQLVQRAALTAPAPVVLDVGSHFGEWSLSLLGQPGSTPTLHAFEPSTYSWKKATESLGDRGTVHQLALSDRAGTADLVIVHEGAGSNSLVPFTEDRASGQTETITLSTVDEFCEEHALERVTLLKVDAEGHDLAVLQGAAGMLAGQAIDLIQFEYNVRWIDSRRFLLDAFELLTPHGYRIGKVTPRGIETYDRWHPELETFREGNYLAYLPDWADRLPTVAWWGP